MQMRPYQLLFVLLTTILAGCVKDRDAELRATDFETFTLVLPPNWQEFSLQGIDSQVGGITDGQDTLVYDYGWYSYDLRHQTSATHKRTTFYISGKQALLVEPKQSGVGLTGIYSKVDDRNKFNLYGQNLKDEPTATQIMRSVKFK